MLALAAFFACLVCMAICRADELAAVTGLVTDPNGRSVAGVTILITDLATNVTSRTATISSLNAPVRSRRVLSGSP